MSDTIVGVFLEQAERRGSAPFLHRPTASGWEPISWAEIRQQALRVAARLVGVGVKPGETVVILSENRVEWILADLAIQAAGAVTVPIFATSTAETIGKIVANSEAGLAFSGSDALSANLPQGVQVLGMDTDLAAWLASEAPADDQAEVERRLAALKPTDVASIIYTSGTTGDPKGVVLPHSNFVTMARASLQDFEIGPGDAMLSFLPFSHVFERQSGVVIAITSGAEMWLSHGLARLAEDIAAASPTVMLGVELRLAEDGELLVKGPGVVREYHRDPKSTAETLEDGWLHTGDLAEIDADGFVRITDRKKDLLKTSNGKYVAPQPIQAKLQ